MLTLDRSRPADQTDLAALFQTVADAMQQAVADRDTGNDLRFALNISGRPTCAAGAEPVSTILGSSARDMQLADARLAASAKNLDSALTLLHEHSGMFLCRTWGEIGGALLEIALMADEHVMHSAAVLVPSGLFDAHVPRLFGWSRLMERAGAGRASSLLLTRARLGAQEALTCGLCDVIGQEPADSLAIAADTGRAVPARAAISSTALRLAQELSERTTRTGGLTSRQARVLERAAFALAFSCGDPREGIASFFANRPARFAPANTGLPDTLQGPAKE